MRNRIDHWCTVEQGNPNPQVHHSSGKLSEASFPTGTVDSRVRISLSPLNTNDGFCIYVVKKKVLISCAVTVQLICTFVFAYAKSRFCRDDFRSEYHGRKLLIQPKLARNYEFSVRNFSKIFNEIYIFV